MLTRKKVIILLVLSSLALIASLYTAIMWLGQNITIMPTREFEEILHAPKLSAHEISEVEIARRGREARLYAYLEAKNSPLASVSETLNQFPNYKLIIALANAESSLCKNLSAKRQALHQCWGVGGDNPWNFGDNWADAVKAMDRFLAEYPKGFARKYQDWSATELNGVYKQPEAAHWAEAVNQILNELKDI